MEKTSFEKVTISDICEKCGMNRKSFYYHFRDKFDLVNNIFETEFLNASADKQYKDGFDFMLDVCKYFESNKTFYKKVMRYDGQNSFYGYFRNALIPDISENVNKLFCDDVNCSFYVDFFADSFINAIKKWVITSNTYSAEDFIALIRNCVYGTAKKYADKACETKTSPSENNLCAPGQADK